MKRQRTVDMDKEVVDDNNNRAKRLRPSDPSLDEMRHVAALLEADDSGDRDNAVDLHRSPPVSMDKGKQRMVEESTMGSAVSGHTASDDSRNTKVVGELQTELK